MITLWLLSRVLHSNLLLALAGLVILTNPAMASLLTRSKKLHNLFSKHRARHWAGGGRYDQ